MSSSALSLFAVARLLPVLLVAFSALGCAAEEDADASQALLAGNRMTCTANGKTLTATGEQVQVGSLVATNDTLSLSLGLFVEQDGEQQSVSTGLLKVPVRAGSYSFPAAGGPGFHTGSFKREDANSDPIKGFSGGNYWLFFAPTETDPTNKLAITFSVLERLPAPTPDFLRLRLKGTFNFNAAQAPEEISVACLRESMQRRLGSKEAFPLYNARICGAELAKVSGEFEVTGEFPVVK